MQMAAPQLIQPFPPGMVATTMPAREPPRPPLLKERTLNDAGSRAGARRLRLIALIAGLGPRSHKRPALMKELRAATLDELRLNLEGAK